MESFFIGHWEIMGGIMTSLIGVAVYFIKQKLNKVDEIEKNYLTRFEDLKQNTSNKFEELRMANDVKHAEILKAISEINVNLASIIGESKTQATVLDLVRISLEQHKQDHKT